MTVPLTILRCAAVLSLLCGGGFASAAPPANTDWPLHGLNYANTRFSPLTDITRDNVAGLQRVWSVHTGVKGSFQATPLVRDGVMYVSTPFNHVIALDAATGAERWRYQHELKRKENCCGPANRGVALGEKLVFIATIDARLVALDRASGKLVWDHPLTDSDVGAMENLQQMLSAPEFAGTTQTGNTGYSANMAPQVVGDMVLVGVTGAGYGLHVETKDKGEARITVAGIGGEHLGLRGFLLALDANTGAERWRWYVTGEHWEGPMQSSTAWGAEMHRDLPGEQKALKKYGESWRYGGGSVWTTPAIDEARGLLYLGTGNPAPQMDDPTRPGDNLHSVSLVALELKTGKLRWAYQQVPHDRWGYDVASPPVLFTMTVEGKPRDVVAEAGKVGYLFVHDRETGELLQRSEPFVPQENLFARPTEAGVRIAPAALGGCSWSPIAVDSANARAYLTAIHWPAMYYSRQLPAAKGLPWTSYTFVQPVEASASYGLLSAVDLTTGKLAWAQKMDKPMIGGVLATAGNVLFAGESGGALSAFASADGRKLWSDQVSAGVNAPPVTYTVNGRQFVAVAAGGNVLFGFKTGDELVAYALPSP